MSTLPQEPAPHQPKAVNPMGSLLPADCCELDCCIIVGCVKVIESYGGVDEVFRKFSLIYNLSITGYTDLNTFGQERFIHGVIH